MKKVSRLLPILLAMAMTLPGCSSGTDSEKDQREVQVEKPEQGDEQGAEDQETQKTPDDSEGTEGEDAPETPEGGEVQVPENLTPIPMKTVELSEDDPEYYAQLLEAEIYNWRVIRSVSPAYETESYTAYKDVAAGLETLDKSLSDDTAKQTVTNAKTLREAMVQIRSQEDSMWYIWGDSMPTYGDTAAFDFSEAYDNEDFEPYIVPYMLEDQSQVKGNMIVIAGGGYQSRENPLEGFPVAERFNELGYNAFVLQRRVAPYSQENAWIDLQRAIRWLRYYAEEKGIGGIDCICASGFSGGGGTIMGQIAEYYGDIQPMDTAAAYTPDEVDTVNSDLDVACVIYGPGYDFNKEDLGITDYAKDNANLPAFFLAAGEDDYLGTALTSLEIYKEIESRTAVEMYIISGASHGFGVGVTASNERSSYADTTNIMYWPELADGFISHQMAAKNGEGGSEFNIADYDIPEQYTKYQNYTYEHQIGDLDVVLAMNEDETEFYITYVFFEEDQVASGTIENGQVNVTYDKTGFIGGEVPVIMEAASPDGWQPIE